MALPRLLPSHLLEDYHRTFPVVLLHRYVRWGRPSDHSWHRHCNWLAFTGLASGVSVQQLRLCGKIPQRIESSERGARKSALSGFKGKIFVEGIGSYTKGRENRAVARRCQYPTSRNPRADSSGKSDIRIRRPSWNRRHAMVYSNRTFHRPKKRAFDKFLHYGD